MSFFIKVISKSMRIVDRADPTLFVTYKFDDGAKASGCWDLWLHKSGEKRLLDDPNDPYLRAISKYEDFLMESL